MKTKLIQLVLLVIAGCSFYFCYELGDKWADGLDGSAPASGWDGGALGMGIICASSLLGIVLLETKK